MALTVIRTSLNSRQNTFDKPKTVVPEVSKLSADEWSKKGKWTVRKHSWSFFVFEGTAV